MDVVVGMGEMDEEQGEEEVDHFEEIE